MNRRCWIGAATILLVKESQSSFVSPPPTSLYQHQTFSTCRYQQQQQRQDLSDSKARAGSSGYSLVRQPVQWDPEADPIFDPPTSRQEEEQQKRLDDEAWLVNRRQQRQQQSKSLQESYRNDNSNPYGPAAELDLFQRTLDTLDYPMVLNALRKDCTTIPARQLVEEATHTTTLPTSKAAPAARDESRHLKTTIPKEFQYAYRPLTATSFEGIQERYGAVREMQLLLNDQYSAALNNAVYRNRKGYQTSLGPPPLQGMSFPLQHILFDASADGVLEGPELLQILQMINVLEDVALWSKGLEAMPDDFVELPKLAGCIQVNVTLQSLLDNAFDKDLRLSGKTFPTLGQLRAKVRTLKGDILNTVQTLLSTPSISSKLALESGGPPYSEVNGRIVIPIDERFAKQALGIIHDASRSGKTIYVEPTEIVGPTNELRQAEAELRAEEARVWRLLTEQVMHNRVALEGSVYAAGQLDLVMARVLMGRKLAGVIPEVGNEGVISLRNAKHPVLLLREIDNVVGSDVDIGANGNQGMVLTGPNSGGKTVILKLLGLVALMARNGIPIPASPDTVGHTPRVDFFAPVLADIGDLQSVGGDLSTFSGHMLVCREVLANSGKNALVLMDELGSGTDPRQGVAIAQALLEALLETGARVAITTHYLELKQLAASDHRFSVGGMQFVNGRPTYKLLPGTVGESFALAVAERLNLPASVVSRANELLDQETRQMGDLIRELEDQKAHVDQQAAELAKKKREMVELEEQMKKEQAKLEQKQLSARRDEAQKFAKLLEEKERVLEDILEKLKSDPSRRVIARSWDEIKFVKRDALTEAENIPSVMARRKDKAIALEETLSDLVPLAELRESPELQVGDKLIVCKKGALYGKEATVLQLGNRLEVQVSGMAVRLKMTELALPLQNYRPPPTPQKDGPKDLSRAAQKIIEAERANTMDRRVTNDSSGASEKSSSAIRTESNTIDVRGKNLEEARSLCKDKFSMCLMRGRTVVYILHGHGAAGVLKSKIREWLKTERSLVKRWSPADMADGGDAFTKVELR